jgi:hypothetical protein
MPNSIQIKHSTATATPASLLFGELAWSDLSHTLFVGNNAGTPVAVGGSGTFAPLASPTFTGTVTIDALAGYIKGVAGALSAQAAPLPPADLGTGTANNTTYLRGDGTWQLLSSISSVPGGATTQIQFNNNGAFAGDVGLTYTFGTGTLTATNISGAGAGITALNATNLATGTVSIPRLGSSGTPSTTTFLRGDNTWAAPSGAASSISIGSPITGSAPNSVLYADSSAALAEDSTNFTYNATTFTLTVTNLAGAGTAITALNASNLASGTVPTAVLGSGTANNTTYLRGDHTWATIVAGVTSVFTRTGAVVAVAGDYTVAQVTGAAPLASPALTGTPTAPTPATADNSTTIATTAFVHAQGYAAALTMTAGTYTKVTVNNQGLVSAGTTLANTDIPKTLDHTWITDFDTQVRTSALNQMAVPTGVVGMNNQLVSNVATPVSPGDATNKGYVDGIAQGLDVKASCMCTTTGNITLSGLQTIDGYTTVAGDRVLVKNQTTNTANGIYVAATGVWTRTPDFSGTQAVSGSNTFIEKGTINASTSWVMTTPDPITIGTSPIVWSQFSGAGTYTASGNGIVLTGTQFSLVGVANQIVISASGIGIASGYTGQTSITTLGAITQCSIDCGTF